VTIRILSRESAGRTLARCNLILISLIRGCVHDGLYQDGLRRPAVQISHANHIDGWRLFNRRG